MPIARVVENSAESTGGFVDAAEEGLARAPQTRHTRMTALVRETLEGVATPARASALLLAALSDLGQGAIPTERMPLEAFVEGNLAARLRESIGRRAADSVVATLALRIDRAFGLEPRRPSLPAE